MASYYDVLGVAVDADVDEVRRAYHRKARLLHPDRYAGSPDADRRRAEAEMKAVNEAWNTLRNAEARRRYDIDIGLTVNSGDEAEYGVDDVWAGDDAESRPSLFRRTGVRFAIAVVVIAAIVVSLIAVLSPPDNPPRWTPAAKAELRSAAIKAGMTGPQADCFVEAITTRYSPSDEVDRALVQQVADNCR